MKWYKKQLDQLKAEKRLPSSSDEDAPKTSRQRVDTNKMRLKKIPKPGEKRSRPKTDAIS